VGEQHSFPWYPPICSGLADYPEGLTSYDHIVSTNEKAKYPVKVEDTAMEKVNALK